MGDLETLLEKAKDADLSKDDYELHDSEKELIKAIDYAPQTRPDRITILEKKKFDIKSFIKKLEDGNAKIVNELYLWDMGEIEGEQEIEKELSKIFEQLKRRSAKRELKDLSKQIKQAELENDKKLLKELSERFKELSEKLV